MKPILITLLFYLGLLGCQNNHNQTSSSIRENNLTKGQSTTNVQEEVKQLDTVRFIPNGTNLTKGQSDPNVQEVKLTKGRSGKNVPRATRDTTQFIAFWKLFRNAVMEHDTKSLASMLHDSILGANFLIRNFTDPDIKTPQTIILEKFYDLFTPDYLLLLQDYDIHKDLFSDIVGLGFKKYQYEKRIGKRTYKARIFFEGYGYQPIEGDSFTAIVHYNMSCDMEEDPLIDKNFGKIYNIVFVLECLSLKKVDS